MKVIKKVKLIEDIIDPELIADDSKPLDVVDLKDADTDDIVADIAQGAKEAGVKAIDTNKAEKDAKLVKDYADLIYNPYGTASIGKIKKALQRSFEVALRNKRKGIDGDYPNVLIYGLAGFGKTSIIREFCKEHNILMFQCDAKNLDAGTVGGIPVPIKKENGETIQLPISSAYWDDLEQPCILFMDELNRANGRVRGSLLGLINDHELPAAIEDKASGRHKAVKKFDNILFTVIAVNPADDLFPDAEPLDPAMISRNSAILQQEPSQKELLGHISKLYNRALNISNTQPDPNTVAKNVGDLYGKVLQDPNLEDKDRKVLEGQLAIANAILTDINFDFDKPKKVRDIFELQSTKGIMHNYLNYRTFVSTLLRSDGTKADYLDVIENESGFIQEDIDMIKNCLANYSDKDTLGNNIFQNSVNDNKNATASSTADIEDLLKSFKGELDL